MLRDNYIVIDAGVENLHLRVVKNSQIEHILIPSNDQIETLFKKFGVLDILRDKNTKLFITGKLAQVVKDTLNHGMIFLSSAVLWAEAKNLIRQNDTSNNSVAIIDLSASGYMVIAIDKNGELKDDLMVTNPHCGAGSGVNLSRILEKLDIPNNKVDEILVDYLGKDMKERRESVQIRADRCGVFSTSATISDKNQGIPIEIALAITMKSEVMKVTKRMLPDTEKVYLTGRVFNWQFMRDCAEDYLQNIGVKEVTFDKKQTIFLNGIEHLVEEIGEKNLKPQIAKKLSKKEYLLEYPSFKFLKEKYSKSGHFKRLPDPEIAATENLNLEKLPINIGLDVGSTMAKTIITDAENDEILFKSSYNNHGDTVTTIKYIFKDFKKLSSETLNIQHIGITGSGRYQVQNVLRRVYPELGERIFVLVENYAHAYGSINYAKEHIKNLKNTFPEINQDFCVLIDIGGEDTKVSTISLEKEELFDNVMNVKCSAGTGSLMDTLKSLFGIESISKASIAAYNSDKAYEINATCAVFLMENARKMQTLGYGKDEILASCNYAIVENMARSLWNQIEFPENALVLLHGQTMLSDPLPLAVTHRIQEKSQMFSLIPPLPGHRACVGLIKSIRDKTIINTNCNLDKFISLEFKKRIVYCNGAACGDRNARCARTLLTSKKGKNKFSLLVGGCTAVNELVAGRKVQKNSLDAYQQIWKLFDSKLPKTEDKNRLVIPRSFAISEYSFFLSKVFESIGIPVYVDNVREQDILDAQPLIDIDICAPLIGAIGQLIRIASEEHGIILVPQIDFLPTNETSLGKTCTTNQGGIAVAKAFAELEHPESNFFLFDLSLKKFEPEFIVCQFYKKFQGLFQYYNIQVSREKLVTIVTEAIKEQNQIKHEIENKVAEFMELAIEENRDIAIVCGREYVLNPGIYDSHTARLLKDKGIIAIPSYAFDVELNHDFDFIYWRNPHDIITKINAIVNKELHKIVINEKLKEIIRKIEQGNTNTSISHVQVSTFRCGPDTVTTPIIDEISKKNPSLFIQSDAMIKELAHLENRVNTYINQLTKKLHQTFENERFDIEIIQDFSTNSLNEKTDVIYFPTLHDNQMVTSVLKGAGLTVIDNFTDSSYDLEKKIRLGRKAAGDLICAPLAGVFADILLAVDDFTKRKKENDPLVNGKNRILIFDNKGEGPCRQGQYAEMHKLLLSKKFKQTNSTNKQNNSFAQQVKLIVGHETDNFNIGLDEWALFQSFHGLILQGVLHSLLMKFGANCIDYEHFQKFYADFLTLKKQINSALENNTKPNATILKIIKTVNKKSFIAGNVLKYFGYGYYNNNGIRKLLKTFSNRWSKLQNNYSNNKIKIHIEGEAYMRVALVQEVFFSLLDAIGFQSFEANYSPLWCYLELLFDFNIQDLEDEIGTEKDQTIINQKRKAITRNQRIRKTFRNVLAKPLYKAAHLTAPQEMQNILAYAKKILPTAKPQGELPAYIGEAILNISENTDLFLNIGPEGCMVSAMGQLFSRTILKLDHKKARIQDHFSLNGEINHEELQMALLKTLGPENYYKNQSI